MRRCPADAAVQAAVALTIEERDTENMQLMQRAIQIAVEEALVILSEIMNARVGG